MNHKKLRTKFIFILFAATLIFSAVLAAQDSDQEYSDALVRAAYNGDFEIVKSLIEKGVDINKGGPLVQAIHRGQWQIVDFLLDNGADINAGANIIETNMFYTPFEAAIRENSYKIYEVLLAEPDQDIDDINAKDINGRNGLMSAVVSSYWNWNQSEFKHADAVNLVKSLISAGIDVNAVDKGGITALMHAALQGYDDIAVVLMEAGADPDLEDLNTGRTAAGWAQVRGNPGPAEIIENFHEERAKATQKALMDAVLEGGIDVVRSIVDDESNIDLNEPLGLAMRIGSWQTAAFLMSHGANVREEDANSESWGEGPVLIYLIRSSSASQYLNKLDLVRKLIDAGADVNATDAKGYTALAYAANSGLIELSRNLIQAGADVNKGGPLVQAIDRGHWEVVEIFLENGADINGKANMIGRTDTVLSPMEAALNENSFKLYEILLSDPKLNKDEINTTNSNGWNVIMSVISHWNGYDIFESDKISLLKQFSVAGVDIDAITNADYTALMYASRYGITAAVEALLEAGADPEVKDMDGKTAMRIAVERKRPESIQALLVGGAAAYADWTVSVTKYQASSTLADSKIANRYSIDKAYDGDPLTSWVEGKDDAGIGEYIELTFDREVTIDAVRVMPGYFDERYWHRNNLIKTLFFKGGSRNVRINFDDEMTVQTITFAPVRIKTLRIEIAEIYKGESWDDTCLAEIVFFSEGKRITW